MMATVPSDSERTWVYNCGDGKGGSRPVARTPRGVGVTKRPKCAIGLYNGLRRDMHKIQWQSRRKRQSRPSLAEEFAHGCAKAVISFASWRTCAPNQRNVREIKTPISRRRLQLKGRLDMLRVATIGVYTMAKDGADTCLSDCCRRRRRRRRRLSRQRRQLSTSGKLQSTQGIFPSHIRA